MHPELSEDAEFVSMFLDEARIASRVQHRNVVNVLDVVTLGDEVMLVAEDPDALCRSALAVCAMAHDDPVLPDARGAVGFGAVTARDGDYVGPLVNTVARASKAADPGGIVVTDDVARALDPRRWSTDPLGPIALRGVRDAVALRRAVPRDENLF